MSEQPREGVTRGGVSCVIPTHQRPGLLAEALASVARQTCRPDEVVVVDDAGDDATRATCERAAAEGLVVRYVVGDRPGASASRNAGTHAASGELIAFLDDDDLWAPRYLERALAALDPSLDAVVTWITLFRDGLVADGHSPGPGLAARDVVATNPGVTGSNLLVRRSALARVGGFDEDLMASNDRDLWFRLLQSACAYGVVQERLVYQRTHTVTSRIATSDPRKLVALHRYRDKHGAHLDRAGRRRLRRQIARTELRFATTRAAQARAAVRFAAAGGIRRRMTPSTWGPPGHEAPPEVAVRS